MTQFPVQNGVAIIPQGTTIINDYAFFGCQDLTTVVIPEGVTTIGESAFRECSSLTHVVFPSTINHIGDLAFFETLWDNNLPDEELYIGTALYKTAYDIRSANVKEGTTCICSGAFACHLNLTFVTLPNTVKYIGGCAFASCRELKTVNIPAGAVIGQGAFMGCDVLEESIYPTICIGDLEFRLFHENMTATVLHCSKEATSVIIPEEVTVGPAVFRVTSIGRFAFDTCKNLTSVAIPNSVTTIGQCAFVRCTTLPSITIPDSVTSIGAAAFWWCTSLESIDIPDSITTIDKMAFGVCTKLKSVTLPKDLKSIGFRSFTSSGLESITIPESVKTIEGQAFHHCEKLENICFAGTIEQWQQIELGELWSWSAPAKQIRCSNGNVNIEKSPK
jgi:hypothetical protein